MTPLRILLVDDEPNMLESLGDVLSREGHYVLKATDGRSAIQIADREELDLVITDVRMPGMDGMTLLRELRERVASAEVIIMTGYGTVDGAVDAMRYGAYHYLLKPFRPRMILSAVQKIAEQKSLMQESTFLNEVIQRKLGLHRLIGTSPPMQRVFQQIRTVARSDATVLITGESGTGKELVAHAIHYLSSRRDKPLIKVACASLPESLLESELFGHERGAFTSAVERRKGRFELADGGSLFLDEIGDIPPSVQAKLVRVLETREFERVGGTQTIAVDVRLIAATHKDLAALVAEGKFREDLYYRINVVPIHLPPLRERRQDIPALATYFLRYYAAKNHKPVRTIDRHALAALVRYSWPGNVRELRNYMERAVLFCKGSTVTLGDLPECVVRPSAARQRGQSVRLGTIREIERSLILNVLRETGWNLSRAAQILGVSRGTLYNKMERYGIHRPAEQEDLDQPKADP
ncbi:MAG: sigma-54 dependent transcriptional regulator [candidate division KSB1 bacterium]|nr:sigma-54 dependent transcriptional regulator [candidate division KSB1 bacterium]